MIIQTVLSHFEGRLELARSNLKKFVTDVQQDAFHAMSWSNSIFNAAAADKVCQVIIAHVSDNIKEGHADIDFLIDMATTRVMYRAANPPQSTSPTSNLIEQCELVEWTKALEYLKNMKEREIRSK